jgi:DNA-binding protein Fis
LVRAAMEQTGNNQIKAAQLLGITRGALQYKLKKYMKQAA